MAATSGRCATAVDHRGRRIGQNQHPRAPRRASYCSRRRSAPDDVADVLAARCRRDAKARRAHHGKVMGAKRRHDRRSRLVGNVSCHRRALLREYANDIGIESAFTIHDREDSADLMNLVRHDLGLLGTDKRFPLKGTCLAIYSRSVNSEIPLASVLGDYFPWCSEWEGELRRLFGGLCRSEAKAERARLRRSAALLGADDDGDLNRRGCFGPL
jgi:hypothetical protein